MCKLQVALCLLAMVMCAQATEYGHRRLQTYGSQRRLSTYDSHRRLATYDSHRRLATYEGAHRRLQGATGPRSLFGDAAGVPVPTMLTRKLQTAGGYDSRRRLSTYSQRRLQTAGGYDSRRRLATYGQRRLAGY